MFILVACLLAVTSPALGQVEFHLTPNVVAVNHQLQTPFSSSLNDLRNEIGMPATFSLHVEQESELVGSFTRQRLRIFYNNIPLRIARLQAGVDYSDAKYKGIVNGYYPNAIPGSFDTVPTINDCQLKTTLVNYINSNEVIPSEITGGVKDSDLINFSSEKQIDIDPVTGNVQLVYAVRCKIDIPLSNGAYIKFPRGLIRVSDGQVDRLALTVYKANGQNYACPKAKGGNLELAGYDYGSRCKKICLNAKKVGNMCSYENEHVKIFDALNSYDRSTAIVKSFKCNQGPNDASNGAFSPTSDAFYYAQQFYAMLNAWTGKTNINSEPIKMFVHFGDQYPNSFFDGNSLSFGDGTPQTFPLTIGEAIGHELAHSLTDGFNSLSFGTEAVALNEAFSDILGKAVTVYDTDVLDWRFSRGFIRGVDALRYFNNPPQDGIAIDHMTDFNPALDVYALMGVYTKFMYELVDINGVNFQDGVNTLVFANQIYWNEETSFIDGACGIMRAARDVGQNVAPYQSSLNAVGINVGFCGVY